MPESIGGGPVRSGRSGWGRQGRVALRRGLPTLRAGAPKLASRTGPGPAKSPRPQKKQPIHPSFRRIHHFVGRSGLQSRLVSGKIAPVRPAVALAGNAVCGVSPQKCALLGRRGPFTATLPPADLHQYLEHVLRRCWWRLRRRNRRPLPSLRASSCKTGYLRHATDERVESGEVEPGAGGGRSSTQSIRAKPELWSSGQCR